MAKRSPRRRWALLLAAAGALGFAGLTAPRGFASPMSALGEAAPAPAVLAAETQAHGAVSNRRQGLAAAVVTLVAPAAAQAEEKKVETPPIEVKLSVSVGGEQGGAGELKVLLHPDWAPLGVERFQSLVKGGNFDDATVFRVVPGFVAQFGLPAKPGGKPKAIKDDEVKVSNKRGTLTFATSGKDTRTNQVFINYSDNIFLDRQGFAPIGEVVSGMEYVDKFYAGYKEKPNQMRITLAGKSYTDNEFPLLAKIKTATITR